jgi:hypothetical protein
MDYEQLIGRVVDAALSKGAPSGPVANERQQHFILQNRA